MTEHKFAHPPLVFGGGSFAMNDYQLTTKPGDASFPVIFGGASSDRDVVDVYIPRHPDNEALIRVRPQEMLDILFRQTEKGDLRGRPVLYTYVAERLLVWPRADAEYVIRYTIKE